MSSVGETIGLRATSALHTSIDRPYLPATIMPKPTSKQSTSQRVVEQDLSGTSASSSGHTQQPTRASGRESLQNTLDPPSPNAVARSEVLKDAVFPSWEMEGIPTEDDSPEEMQKKDPLGTQIWKLYSRTKSRLPNQERMENLTWRMMAMNLRRREQMQTVYADHPVA